MEAATVVDIAFVLGMVLCTGAITFGMGYLVRQDSVPTRRLLIIAVLYALSVLLGVWAADKIVTFRLKILSVEESLTLFTLIKDLSLLIFGYYFGVADSPSSPDPR